MITNRPKTVATIFNGSANGKNHGVTMTTTDAEIEANETYLEV